MTGPDATPRTKTVQMSGGPLDGQHVDVESWAREYGIPYLADIDDPYPIPVWYRPRMVDGEPVANDRGEQVWACRPNLPPPLTAERVAERHADFLAMLDSELAEFINDGEGPAGGE